MDFSKLPSWTWSAAGFVLALGIGVMIGRGSAPDPADQSSAPNGARGSRFAARGTAAGGAAGKTERGGESAREEAGLSGDMGRDFESILEEASRMKRTQRLLAMLDRLPDDQFADAYQTVCDSPLSALRGVERSLVLQAWAERDPHGALAHLQENGAEDWERETTVSAWAASDPHAAFEWASAAADEGRVNNWVLGAMRGIAATSPDLARDFLMSLDGETRERSLGAMQPYVMQYGFNYAMNWVQGVADPGLQNMASRRFARDLTELDPVQAGSWNAAIADRDTRRDVSEMVSDRWARQDLEGAKAWVDSLPEDTRTEAAEGVARHYARENPTEAAQWLSGLGDNPDLDGAKRILIDESFRKDPAVSLGFVNQLADQKAQTGYYHRYLGWWMKKDANAAKAWTEDNQGSLPESIVKRVLR